MREREVRINISTVNDDEITHFNSVGAGDVVTKFEIPAEKIGNGKTAVCVTAVYEGDVLVKCVPQTVTFSGADISTETVLTLDSVTDKTNVMAFVWTDSFVPITSAKKVTSSAQN